MSSLLIALITFQLSLVQTTLPRNDKDLCFTETVCTLKESVRWKTPKWDVGMCSRVASAIIRAEKMRGIPRELSMSIMLNESDMNDRARRETNKNGKLVAVDGGLMGNRCVLDEKGKYCINYKKSLYIKPADLLNPETSIELATQKLAAIRDRDPCPHKDHPWFAHYNWGGKTFKDGIPAYYPYKVALIWKAIADVLGTDVAFLYQIKYPIRRKNKPLNIDVPFGQRYIDMVAKIKRCNACKPGQEALAIK